MGGWQEYLSALKRCWEPVFAWYAAGTLTAVRAGCACLALHCCAPRSACWLCQPGSALFRADAGRLVQCC